MFNFFIIDLVKECQDAGVGAKCGDLGIAIVAYCDDLVLMSPNSNGIQKLLNICEKFADRGKLEFNASKSIHCEFFEKQEVELRQLPPKKHYYSSHTATIQ